MLRTPMKNEQPAAEPIRLTGNAIISGKFHATGEPLPFDREEGIARGFEAAHRRPDRPRRSSRPSAISTPLRSRPPSPPLREDVREQVESANQRRMGLALAQAKFNQDTIDNAHEAAARAAEPPQRYVRRGGAWGRVEAQHLSPANPSFRFARTANTRPWASSIHAANRRPRR